MVSTKLRRRSANAGKTWLATTNAATPRAGSAVLSVAHTGSIIASGARMQGGNGQGSVNVSFQTGAISTLGAKTAEWGGLRPQP